MTKLYGPVRTLLSIGSDTITHSPDGMGIHHLIHESYDPYDPFNETTFISKFNTWVKTQSGATSTAWRTEAANSTLSKIVGYYNGSTFRLRIYLASDLYWTPLENYASQSDFRTACADWGISINTTPVTQPTERSTITLSSVQTGYRTQSITKLYGSVNGQTKLVKKLYGSVNGQTKLVYEAPNA